VGTSTDPGFNPDRVAIMWKTLDHTDVNPEGAQRFFMDLEERLEALPEVQDVEVARRAEASMMDLSDQAVLEIPGYAAEQGQPLVVPYSSMTPGFVSMLELPLLRGRTFTDADGPGAPGVAMVNEAFIRRFWPDSDGLGRSFTIKERLEVGTPTPAPSTVIQVVGVLQDPPVTLPGSRAEPFIWLPFFQDYPSRAVIHIKGRTSAAAMVPILRREVPLSPGEVPLIPAQTYADAIRGVFVGHEMASKALTWAGLFALVLAIMGIYGVVSFAVAQRVREMAIRQAIGAGDAVVLKQLIWEGMGPTLLGTGIGLLLAGGVALMLRSEFFGVGPLDPLALGSVTGVLLVSALIATLVPARRALRTAPMEVLRQE
jgi:putative ABC transport system permease protein